MVYLLSRGGGCASFPRGAYRKQHIVHIDTCTPSLREIQADITQIAVVSPAVYTSAVINIMSVIVIRRKSAEILRLTKSIYARLAVDANFERLGLFASWSRVWCGRV